MISHDSTQNTVVFVVLIVSYKTVKMKEKFEEDEEGNWLFLLVLA
jgi:hypothetical protein